MPQVLWAISITNYSMINRKLFATISICFMAVTTSLAGHRTEREMLSVAQRQLASHAMTRGMQSEYTAVERLLDSNQYCIYGKQDAGFVVISRNDNFPAVMAYSTTIFNADNIPCGMKWWLEAVDKIMQQDAPRTNKSQVAHSVVDPLVTTEWGQGDPYNFLTPEENGQHTPTGCMATAMSQMMKFYNYPVQGRGHGYYTLADNTAMHIPVDITSTYAWGEMQDVYRYKKVTDEERLPVAQLMSDAGIATYMNYGASGSGAYPLDATRGFVDNFSYNADAIRCYDHKFFSDDEWFSLLYNELSSGNPILYCGTDQGQGGHAFVIDGIDADGLVHVNWGWDGECNGFYNISDLSPVDERGNNQGHFISEQSMVFGLRARVEKEADEHMESIWCSPNESYSVTGGKKRISIDLPVTYNYHFLQYTGTLYLVLENVEDALAEKQAFAIGQSNSYSTYYGFSTSQMFLTTKLQAGNYLAYVASKAEFDLDYQPIRCLGGPICYNVVTDADGNNVVSGPQAMGEPTAIQQLKLDKDTAASPRYFDLQGREVPSTTKGLLIRKQGDEVKKVMMK